MNGWIKIHRRLLEWEWYDDDNMFRLWIHLLLKASPTDREWHNIELKRGQYVTSLSELSEETGLSKRNLRTCIERLKNDTQIDTQTTHQYTIITICNYDKYQVTEDVERHTNDTQADTQATHKAKEQKERDKESNKEINKEKKESPQEEKKHSIECQEKDAAHAATLTQKRKEAFYQTIIPYINKYSKEMLRDFFDYWSETNRSQTKMRFEQQPTWEVGKRLATWARNDKHRYNGQQSISTANVRLAKLADILTG